MSPGVLVIVKAANEFEHGASCPGQQRLKQLHDRQEINLPPMHGPHASHEPRLLKRAVVQDVQRILLVPDGRLASRINDQIVLPVKKSDLLVWDLQGLCCHVAQILSPQPLPARSRRKIQGDGVDNAFGFDPDPCPPVQLHACPGKFGRPVNRDDPLAFMYGIPFVVCREDSATVSPVKDAMPAGLAADFSTGRCEVAHVGKVRREGKVAAASYR